MSSVSSIGAVSNPGVAELMQTLAGSGVSLFSSPAMPSALQDAPPQDVAELSVAAVQMQSMDQLFGIADGTSQTPDGYNADMSTILATLNADAGASANTDLTLGLTGPASSDSLATQLARYQLDAQGAENSALLGGGASTIRAFG